MPKQQTMHYTEFRVLMAKEGRSKYKNVRVTGTPDGDFDSGHEYKCWLVLKQDQADGKIRNLQRQVTFPLRVSGTVVAQYIADFTYEEKRDEDQELLMSSGATIQTRSVEWLPVVADAKGCRTEMYRLKKKMMAAQGVTIREI